MGELFDQISVEAVRGEDITIGEKYGEEFYISEYDKILCYVGVLMKNNSRATDSLNIWPYYMRGKHSYDKLISNKIIDFIRLIEGCIVLDDYVDGQWRSEEKYKKIEAFIRYPSSESYYGVFVDRVEDEELTRIVFGLTYRELSRLTECYAKAWGIYNEYQHYPRVTRSIRSANLCDITGAWIPEKFPYITFAESGFAFSHVSLWGFYRYVQLIMNNDVHSPFGQLLIKMGAEPELLERTLKIGRNIYGTRMITWNMLNAD